MFAQRFVFWRERYTEWEGEFTIQRVFVEQWRTVGDIDSRVRSKFQRLIFDSDFQHCEIGDIFATGKNIRVGGKGQGRSFIAD